MKTKDLALTLNLTTATKPTGNANLTEDNSRKCTILVGPPASGKSTWAKQHRTGREFFLSSDAIIDKIAADHGYTYDEAFKDLIAFADRAYWDDVKRYGKAGWRLVLDRTHMSVKSRRRVFETLKPFGYTFDAIIFETPESQEWKRRLESRPGKTIPTHILNSMLSSYTAPTLDEGFASVVVNREVY